MDNKKLKHFIVTQLLRITNEWNKREGIYPVKPNGLTEAHQTLWALFVEGTGGNISGLTPIATSALRATLEEAIGTHLPDGKEKTIKDVPPYVVLVTTNNSFGISGLDEGRTIMKKSIGPWTGENGKTATRDSFSSTYTRMPTAEEIESMVDRVPGDLVTVFADLIPVKDDPEARAWLIEAALSATDALFASAPSTTLTSEQLTMYSLGRLVGDSARVFIIFMTDKTWVDSEADEAYKYSNAPFSATTLSCVTYKRRTRVLHSQTYQYTASGAATIEGLEWSAITKPDKAHIEKAISEIPISLFLSQLPEEMRNRIVDEIVSAEEEVKLE